MKAATALILVLLVICADAQQKQFNCVLNGRVVDVAGAPVGRASVAVSSSAMKDVQLITGEDGRFVAALPCGAYQLFVTRAGFQPLERTVNIKAAKSTDVELGLGIAKEAFPDPMVDGTPSVLPTIPSDVQGGLPIIGADTAAEKEPVTFRIVSVADVVDVAASQAGFLTPPWSDGKTHIAVTSFKGSNGVGVSLRSVYLKTPLEANRYLDWKLASAAKITEQGDNTDTNGNQIGRRAIMLLKSGGWAVVCTQGSTFRSFDAANLTAVLEFEKQYREPNFLRRSYGHPSKDK